MPAAVGDAAAKSAGKRKRQENGDIGKKRRKSGGGDGDNTDGSLTARIQTLETEIQESKKHYNNIATLVELAQKHDEDPRPPWPPQKHCAASSSACWPLATWSSEKMCRRKTLQ